MKSSENKGADSTIKKLFFRPLLLLWAVGVCVFVAASLVPDASLTGPDTNFGFDKVVRIIILAVLSFYPVAFFISIKNGLIMASFVAPIGFFLEVLQKYVPGRNFSPHDMIANNIGAILGIILALLIRTFFSSIRNRRRQKT